MALFQLLRLAPIRIRQFLLAAIAGGLSSASGVALTVVAAWLISRAAGHPAIVELSLAAVAVRAFALSRATLRYVERLLTHDLTLRWLGDLRVLTYMRMIPLLPGNVAFSSGDVLDATVCDVDAVGDVLARGVTPILSSVILAMASLAFCEVVVPAMLPFYSLLFFAASVLLPLLSLWIRSHAAQSVAQVRGSLVNSTLDILDGLPELVVYGTAEECLSVATKQNTLLCRSERRNALLSGLVDTVGVLLGGVALVGGLMMAITAVHSGSVRPELVASLALCGLATIDMLMQGPQAWARLVDGELAARRLVLLYERPPAVQEPEVTVEKVEKIDCELRVEIEMQNVSVKFQEAPYGALRNTDLLLRSGVHVAVTGPSGSGKSTLAKALVRFVPLDAGRLLFNGTDATTLSGDDVRHLVTLVDQESYLFAGTLRDNLRLANPNVTDDQIRTLGDALVLTDWVSSLPQGWDTVVEEAGRSLSGGEFRRLCVMRALLAKSSVVILDEPTEHLNSEIADAMTTSILRILHDRTVIWITHRIEEVAGFDEVLVMGNGEIVERRVGTSLPGLRENRGNSHIG